MKQFAKLALVAASALTVVASATAATYNGDLLVGFTTTSGNDLIYDLGSETTLQNGETWSLNSLLGTGLNTSSVHWGVVGATAIGGLNTSFTTTANLTLTPAGLNRGGYTAVHGAVVNIDSLVPAAAQGSSAAVDAANANSWNVQTLNPTLNGDYKNAYEDPNSTGYTTEVLWSVPQSSTGQTGGTEVGTFSFDNTGTLTFDSVSVPEPSTYGLFAGVGLLAISLRRQFAKA